MRGSLEFCNLIPYNNFAINSLGTRLVKIAISYVISYFAFSLQEDFTMIKELSISGFRGFGQTQSVKFAISQTRRTSSCLLNLASIR